MTNTLTAGSLGEQVADPTWKQTAEGSDTLAPLREASRMLRAARYLAQDLGSELEGIQKRVLDVDLDRRADIKVRLGAPTLLAELSRQRGLAWSDIAQLIGVTSSALRKWRGGEPPTGKHRLGLAKLAVFLDLIDEHAIEDPGGWLEVPLRDGYTVRRLDLYAAGRWDLLLAEAGKHRAVTDLLDDFDPQWRQSYRSEFEVVRAQDGLPSIQRRK